MIEATAGGDGRKCHIPFFVAFHISVFHPMTLLMDLVPLDHDAVYAGKDAMVTSSE